MFCCAMWPVYNDSSVGIPPFPCRVIGVQRGATGVGFLPTVTQATQKEGEVGRGITCDRSMAADWRDSPLVALGFTLSEYWWTD